MIDGGLRKEFHARLKAAHWQAVETGGVGLGVPDSNYCIGGLEGWVEFKQTDGWVCGLRPEQIGWLVRRHRAGGRVFVATRRWHDGGPRKGPATDELWLHDGGLARELSDHGLGEKASPAPLGWWAGGPSGWDWGAVLEILTK